MTQNDESNPANPKKIVIIKDGPYYVSGGMPLVRKTQVVSENGEPLTWEKEGVTECDDDYALCRCGQSANKPFCDGSHRRVAFDGSEQANTGARESGQALFPAGRKILVEKDASLCMQSGFCGFENASLPALIVRADRDTQTRSLVIAMVERCPSGALTYRLAPDMTVIEPDLPQQIAETVEITSGGPITGPLWVSGGIAIERSDGKPFEPRNRVTLCNCGKSGNKPLCDGTHRVNAEREARAGQRSGEDKVKGF
jgi:CDGSH-type Zn-finger protein